MNPIVTYLELACGKPLADTDGGPARRMQIVAGALLTALAFAAFWGAAVGCRSTPMALANLYKVPMVVLISAVSAAPAGLLAFKLSGAPGRASDLLLAFACSIFGGTLVLAVAAPLVAIYYHSSLWAGPIFGEASALIALFVGGLMFARSAFSSSRGAKGRGLLIVPIATFAIVQLAMLAQLAVLAAPILPERAVAVHGIDRLLAK